MTLRLRAGLAAASLAAVLSLSACSSPEPTFYTLTPSPGTSRSGAPQTIEVETPVVADYLNRDDIVLDNNDNQLHVARRAAWAEPLAGAIGRNLALDLSQRLPGSSVYTASSGLSLTADAVVEVNVSRFARDSAGRAEITAMVSTRPRDRKKADIRSVHITSALPDQSPGALAAGLSQLLGQVADQVAAELLTLPRR